MTGSFTKEFNRTLLYFRSFQATQKATARLDEDCQVSSFEAFLQFDFSDYQP